MRYLPSSILIFIISISLTTLAVTATSDIEDDFRDSIIIEVEGDPHRSKEYLNTYHPYIEVITVYDKLINGLALKVDPEKRHRLQKLEFITAIHPVQSYKINAIEHKQNAKIKALEDIQESDQVVFPNELNNTTYTGRGVKVAVIDTGIDAEHPDLKGNYQGGYDLVDLDDDPTETTPEQGVPTMHGSHVAGIIAGNGALTGVAPEADIYAYRALGPGGMGTSIHIIAAMEQAVRDGVNIINLSLGNDVNGPDYPTSVAVNHATKLGISVVIANGNSGPDDWTVGSPATASKALSVGAAEQLKRIPHLYEPINDESIPLVPFIGSTSWQLTKDYAVTNDETEFQGNIALIQRGETPFYELAKSAEKQGAVAVLIYNNDTEDFQGTIATEEDPITIPVAQISKKHGEWLRDESDANSTYLKTDYKEQSARVAEFSSRGPVAVNWKIKPDVIAPGTDIISTVPGGYQILQGTSMAAPHVAGVVALMKEAQPDWTNDQIIGALKTTAHQMTTDEELSAPTIQGSGLVNPKQALETGTIIYDPALSFGQVTRKDHLKTAEVIIENMTNHSQTYHFDIPKKQQGMTWKLPQSITLDKHEKQKIPIELNINTQLLNQGMHQDWLTLKSRDQSYQLPYLFINGKADQPKAMGFDFSIKPLEDDTYKYQLYVTEQTKSVDISLYNPDTLVKEQDLIQIDEPEVGLNEGDIPVSKLKLTGGYLAMITVELETGDYESYESMVYIDPL